MKHLLPPLLVLNIGLHSLRREEVEVFASRKDQKFLTLRNESLQGFFEVVVDSFDAVLAVDSKSITQRRHLLYHFLAALLRGWVGSTCEAFHTFVDLLAADKSRSLLPMDRGN